MSDELLDGRNLRNRPTQSPPPDEEEDESLPDAPAASDEPAKRLRKRLERMLDENPFALDPPTGTHPYVILQPPETGGIIEKPVVQEPEQPAPAPDVDKPVESDSQRLMKLPRVKIEEVEEAAEPPAPAEDRSEPPDSVLLNRRPDYVPHFHTPTTEAPPVPDLGNARPPAEPTQVSSPTQPRPRPEYVPHFHTPTGEMPAVADGETAAGGDTPPSVPRVEGDEAGEPGVEEPAIKIEGRRAPMTPARGTRAGAIPPDASAATQVAEVREFDEETGEVIDADWILEVGQRMQQRDPIARRKMPKARSADEPSSLYITIRRSSRWLLPTVIGGALVVALIIFVPRALPDAHPALNDQGGGAGGAWATVTPGPARPTARASAPAGGGGTTPRAPTATPPPAHAQGRIVYVTSGGGDYEIAVLAMATGTVKTLTANTFSDRSPAWSPDGQRIVFISDRGGTEDVWVMNADGSRPVQVTRSADSDHFPVWSPDGSLIVFSREAVIGSSLAAVDTACLSQPETCEGLVRPITTERYDRYPAWAPGGGQIAFTAGTIPGEPTTIALMNIDGSGYTPLAGTGTSDSNPAWAPDGMRIAFVSYARGDEDLWIMGRLGQNLVQLTKSSSSDVGPSWSPDGSLIVFASDREDSFDLYVIRADCASPDAGCEAEIVRLTTDPGDELDPVWTR